MDEPYLKGNKEGTRPHYYCYEDSATGLYWMIPLSSRVDKYKKIVENKKEAGNHLMLTSEHTVKAVEQKAKKVVGMLKRGIKFTPTQPDVIKIIEKLIHK